MLWHLTHLWAAWADLWAWAVAPAVAVSADRRRTLFGGVWALAVDLWPSSWCECAAARTVR